MVNLLSETIKTLASHGKMPSDVEWVSDGVTWDTWERFTAYANVAYDNGYGGQNVASSLVVVGVDWWLERHEYDGSEWWEFKTLPTKPSKIGKVNPLNRWY